jgi:hypothetical protein
MVEAPSIQIEGSGETWIVTLRSNGQPPQRFYCVSEKQARDFARFLERNLPALGKPLHNGAGKST